MYLVEVFVPRYYRNGNRVEAERLKDLQQKLAQKFGGVTAFLRSSARGLWMNEQGMAERDEIAIFEVMTPGLDRQWWKLFRAKLEAELDQDEILIRVTDIERI